MQVFSVFPVVFLQIFFFGQVQLLNAFTYLELGMILAFDLRVVSWRPEWMPSAPWRRSVPPT